MKHSFILSIAIVALMVFSAVSPHYARGAIKKEVHTIRFIVESPDEVVTKVSKIIKFMGGNDETRFDLKMKEHKAHDETLIFVELQLNR